jgi:hypothetical protein
MSCAAEKPSDYIDIAMTGWCFGTMEFKELSIYWE